jgi:hypothetical protein
VTNRIYMDLIQVEAYLVDVYDVCVSFEEDGLDEYWFDPKTFHDDPGHISINSHNDPEHQLYVLLHEAGHVKLRSDQEEFLFRFPDSSRDTAAGRIEILKEEVAAWHEGLGIAERLGVIVDMGKWKRNYREALSKYIIWIGEEGQYEE